MASFHIYFHPFSFLFRYFLIDAESWLRIFSFSFNRALRASFACFCSFVLALTLFLAEFTADSAEVILFLASSNLLP